MSPPNTENESAHLSAVPSPPDASEVAVAPEPSPRGSDADDDRVSRTLFLLVLLGFFVCAVGFGVQSQRAGEYQTRIETLEDEAAGLSADLADAEARVEGFLAQRRAIQRQVQGVISEVMALETLVASDPADLAFPEDAGLAEGELQDAFEDGSELP